MQSILNYLKHLLPYLKYFLSIAFDDLDRGSTQKIHGEVGTVSQKNDIVKEEKEKQKKETKTKKKKIKIVLPTNNIITSNFGYRKLKNYPVHFHGAHDYSANRTWNYPCRAVEDGRVFINHYKKNLSVVAIVGKHTGCFHYYCHVGSKNNRESNVVTKGQNVKAGQVIGFCNRTGRTTGPHVHYAVYDPEWNCIDPIYFFRKYAPEIAASLKNYVDKGQIHPKLNKSGNPKGVL